MGTHRQRTGTDRHAGPPERYEEKRREKHEKLLRMAATIMKGEANAAVAELASEATKIRRDHRELLCETRRDLMPLDMRLRIPVQEKERRTTTATHGVDRRPGCLDHASLETGEQR